MEDNAEGMKGEEEWRKMAGWKAGLAQFIWKERGRKAERGKEEDYPISV